MMMMSETLPCRGLFRGNYGKDKQLPPQMTSTTLLTCIGRKRKKVKVKEREKMFFTDKRQMNQQKAKQR